MEADIEGAFEGCGVALNGQSCGRRSLGGESEFGEMRDHLRDLGGGRAEFLIELLWRQELMEFCVAGCVDCVEKYFGFVAIAETKCDCDGECRLRAERSAVNRFRCVARWKGKRDSSFNGCVGLCECWRNTTHQDKERHKHAYCEFQWVPPREKIYRAEIFVTSRTTTADTSGGDSVGECLHRSFVNCQLDICKDC